MPATGRSAKATPSRSTQPAKSGGVDVTLDVFREHAAVATFSFVQGN